MSAASALTPRPRAVVFDFNGTLSDDEPILDRLFREVFASVGIALTSEDYFRDLAGFSDPEIVERGLRGAGREPEPELCARLLREKIDRYVALVDEQSPIEPEVVAFVRTVAGQVPVAVASGALREEVERVLAGAGLLDLFATVVCIDDVCNGKPDPEGYDLALARLNKAVRPDPPIAAADVLVFEDATVGALAAAAAGMRCVALRGPAYDAAAAPAAAVVDALDAALAARLFPATDD